ncbi:MAG: TetR/AcrR family transcriptional regulator [Ramlibacter sp.]|nr:TetR/AcrR family transcriptional regulator [Cryobacterium sp.]
MTSNSAIDRAPRADAQRNRAAIIDAALSCLAAKPTASMAVIAQAAGVGRVTLYGHFSSRTELIEAATVQIMSRVDAELSPLDLDGDPRDALERLVTRSWRILDDLRGILTAGEQELGTDRIRENHDQSMRRVHQLIERGQAESVFRSDQSAGWLTACYFAILHGAATEIRAGRLSETQAATVIPETIQAIMSVPAARAARTD